jgi:hypothetical protein
MCTPGTTVHPPRMNPKIRVAVRPTLPDALNVAHISMMPSGLSRALQRDFRKGAPASIANTHRQDSF